MRSVNIGPTYFMPSGIPEIMQAKYYKHFKGGEYELVAVGLDSETLEKVVVYRALYGDGQVWVRPYAMFFGTVEVDGETVPRFREIPRP